MMGYFIATVIVIIFFTAYLRTCMHKDIESLVKKHYLETPPKEKDVIKETIENKALYTKLSKLLQLESYSINTHPIATKLIEFFIFKNSSNYTFKKIMFILVGNQGIQIYLNEVDPRLKTSIIYFKFDELLDPHNSVAATYIFDIQNKKFYSKIGSSYFVINDRFKFIAPLVYLIASKLNLYASISGVLTNNCNIGMVDSLREHPDLFYTDVVKMYIYISEQKKIPNCFIMEQFKKEILRELARFNQHHLK